MQCSMDRVASSRACSSSTKTVVAMGCLAVPRAPCSGRSCGRYESCSRRVLSVAAAYAPSLPSPGSQAARPSLDPMAAAWEQAWEAGRLLTVKSPEQFSELQQQYPDKLIVLMCKSHACRPCKMFTRKYLSVAQRFPDCILAEIYGDETPATRKMMMTMEVKVTPTFRMYRGADCVNVVAGTNEKKLMRGILAAMTAAELAAHEQEIADTLSIDEADQQPAAAAVQVGSS